GWPTGFQPHRAQPSLLRFRRLRRLHVELAAVAGARDFAHFLHDELADAHALHELNGDGADVPDFQAQPGAVVLIVVLVVSPARVNRGRGDVDAQAHPRETALAFHPRTQPRFVGQVDPLQGPPEDEVGWRLWGKVIRGL